MRERRKNKRHFVRWTVESDCGQIGGTTINLGRDGCLLRNDKLSFLRHGDRCHVNLIDGDRKNRVAARVVSAKSNLSVSQIALMFQDQIDVNPVVGEHAKKSMDVLGQIKLIKKRYAGVVD
ncbi:MAG: PilZ domain-containing protein [Myxococcota bacterium]|nr:PilZ domain-containing protein [Myxococcota bacterium]